MLVPVAGFANGLGQASAQEQYENLMKQSGAVNIGGDSQQPFYNKGYGNGTTYYHVGEFGQQPAQSAPGLGQAAPPTFGFAPSVPGFRSGY